MTIRIFSGYSTDYIRPMTASIVKAVLTDQYVDVAAPTGRFFTGFSGSVDNWAYADFLVQLGTTFSANYSGRTAFTFSYDWASNRVTMTALSNSIPVGLNTIWDIGLQRILGFNNQYISQSIIVGDAPPWYVWTATNDRVTDDSEVYEDEPLYKERVADSGRSYSVGRNKTVLYQDWIWGMEPINNVFQNQALITNAFTYDIFIKELRKGPYQFVSFTDEYQTLTTLSYAVRNGTYEIREEGFSFKPKAALGDETDFVAYWNIPIKTRLLSRPNINPLNDFANLPVTGGFLTPPANGLSLWVKADGSNSFVSQSLQSACFSLISDSSGMNNSSPLNSSSKVPLMQNNDFGPSFGVSGAYPSISSNSDKLIHPSASFYGLTASGFSIAFPYRHANYTGGQDIVQFAIACSTSNVTASFSVYNYDFYATNKTLLATMIFSSSLANRIDITRFATASLPHFAIFTFDNTAKSGKIYVDGSEVWYNPATLTTWQTASNIPTGVTSSLNIQHPFRYQWEVYTNAATSNFQQFVPEILVYNHQVSASEINQINAYFYSRYPVVTYSLQ